MDAHEEPKGIQPAQHRTPVMSRGPGTRPRPRLRRVRARRVRLPRFGREDREARRVELATIRSGGTATGASFRFPAGAERPGRLDREHGAARRWPRTHAGCGEPVGLGYPARLRSRPGCPRLPPRTGG